jgi:hypothetical protein
MRISFRGWWQRPKPPQDPLEWAQLRLTQLNPQTITHWHQERFSRYELLSYFNTLPEYRQTLHLLTELLDRGSSVYAQTLKLGLQDIKRVSLWEFIRNPDYTYLADDTYEGQEFIAAAQRYLTVIQQLQQQPHPTPTTETNLIRTQSLTQNLCTVIEVLLALSLQV